jgi:hypothetical protein
VSTCQSCEPGDLDAVEAELGCLAIDCLCYCHRVDTADDVIQMG